MHRPFRSFLPVIGAVALAALTIPSVARAQRSYTFPLSSPVRGSLVAGGRLWVIGNPLMVAEGVQHVLPSPDFKHLLIARKTRALMPDTPGSQENQKAAGEMTLSWWTVRTHRSREFWRLPIAPGHDVGMWMNGWLGKTGSAVVRIAEPAGVRILYVNPAAPQVKEVVIPPKTYDFPSASPGQPFVALFGPDGAAEGEMQFLDRTGSLGEKIPLPSNIFFSRWSEDGTALRGVGTAPGADGKRVEQWYAVSPARRTVTPIPEPKKTASGETDYDDFGDPAESLPIRLKVDAANRGLYLETFPASKARVLLSADGDPAFLLPDGSGVFFRRDGALYFAPIVSARAASTQTVTATP